MYWVDFAKALAVVLVVVYHVGAAMDFVFPNPDGPGSLFWGEFNRIAVPLRMPLFFVAAGILAHSAIARPWGAVVRPRIVALLWPYLLWGIVIAVVAGFAYLPENPSGYTVGRLQGLPFAYSAYWFLLMLPVFFVVAKSLRRFAPFVLVASLVLAVAAPWLETHVFNEFYWTTIYGITRVARYLFWYLLGSYAFHLVAHIASIKPQYLIVFGGGGFAAITWFSGGSDPGELHSFALSVAGVTTMIGLSVWVSIFPGTRRASRYLAERTLPIYLVHPMLLVLVIIVDRAFGNGPGPNDELATFLTPLIAAVCIAAGVLLYNVVSRTPATAWVFAPPGRERRIKSAP